jgi:hypothetical protein
LFLSLSPGLFRSFDLSHWHLLRKYNPLGNAAPTAPAAATPAMPLVAVLVYEEESLSMVC